MIVIVIVDFDEIAGVVIVLIDDEVVIVDLLTVVLDIESVIVFSIAVRVFLGLFSLDLVQRYEFGALRLILFVARRLFAGDNGSAPPRVRCRRSDRHDLA
ncbi:hypothetical protein SB2_26945 [Methylobacterium radiotolerans]|nr:hypothetical protein SB3_22565 [Methylobacterium radiotolerans]KTS43714.1 hypothetical protein SB2_26945 [Methylobacterium radiotolerans]KZC02279.1 hypothetical protein AU375_01468 [Methylobacterium radiotolerans]ONF49030.1 hypothetical protein RSM1_11125 [Methylobacterium radiotolerans]